MLRSTPNHHTHITIPGIYDPGFLIVISSVGSQKLAVYQLIAFNVNLCCLLKVEKIRRGCSGLTVTRDTCGCMIMNVTCQRFLHKLVLVHAESVTVLNLLGGGGCQLYNPDLKTLNPDWNPDVPEDIPDVYPSLFRLGYVRTFMYTYIMIGT